jgi:hypothetical protein
VALSICTKSWFVYGISYIQKAEIKLRLITDTYMLQYHHAKFSRNKISPICKLCGEEEEDREHFYMFDKFQKKKRETVLEMY